MTLIELMRLLRKIKKCHPEAGDASVVSINYEGDVAHPNYVGYDKKHKPARIKLEE